MGIFSGKTIISVASTVYNMAGPEEDRSNFLKANMFAAIMSPHDKYLGETLVTSYINGPGLKQRQFFNWAKRNNYSGMPTFTAQRSQSLSTSLVQQYVPLPAGASPGSQVFVQDAEIVKNDIEPFARQYILENDPDEITKDYRIDYASDGRILITYYTENDTAFPINLWNADSGYSPDKEFIVANYYVMEEDASDDVVEGTLVEDVYAASLPDDTGFTEDTNITDGTVSFTLVTTTTVDDTYSDGRPDEQSVSSDSTNRSLNQRYISKSSVEYQGGDGQSLETQSETTFHNIWLKYEKFTTQTVTTTNTDIGGGVTRTRTTTVDEEDTREIYDYRIDTQMVTHAKIEGDYVWIYEVGSGIVALDAKVQYQTVPAELEFFPFIPLRLDNVGIDEEPYTTDSTVDLKSTYDEAKAAYRKVSNGENINTILDTIADNEDIDDIDYAYMMFGVSANVKEKACRKYMYHFLNDLSQYQNTTGAYMTQFESDVVNYLDLRDDVQDWIARNDREAGILPEDDVRPEMPTLSSPETTTIQLKTDSSRTSDLDLQISWVSIHEEEFTGVATKNETEIVEGEPVTETSPAEAGDIWFEKDGSFDWQLITGVGIYQDRGEPFVERENAIEKTYLYWQVDNGNYKRLTIYGLIHQNFIYGGKSVDITLHEALDDNDTSGFIMPLNIELFKEMGIVDYTQMATANSFIIFNSYDVVKQKWYQSFFGMLLVIVLVVAAAAIIAPSALAGASGILGTNAAIGAAAGLAGTAAVVAGAVANAIVGVIVSMVVSGLTADLGFIGQLIGQLVNFALAGGLGAGGLGNLSLTTIFNPSNLLKLSSMAANGYASVVRQNIADMNDEMIEDREKFDSEMERISNLIKELGGSNDLQFDAMSLTDTRKGNGSETGDFYPESLDVFIHRTTMTGSDVVDITLSLISDHADLSLTLPKTI